MPRLTYIEGETAADYAQRVAEAAPTPGDEVIDTLRRLLPPPARDADEPAA